MYDILLKPGKIGKLELKNRFVMTPANLAYATKDGFVTTKIIEFYRKRAEGGVGLITVGAMGVDPERICTGGVMQLSKNCYMDGVKDLVDAIHSGGAKVVPQLWHPGAYAVPDQYNGQTPVSASSFFCKFSGTQTEELSVDEIEKIIGYFADAARRAKDCGFDGLELVGSAGYLISQFLSSATNHRTDKYGGDLNQRMTFLREVVAAVKAQVGPDFPIIVRLAGNEFVPNGNDNDDCVAIAIELEKLGVDALNITGGWHETAIPQVTMDVPHGAYSYLAKRVKEAVSIPVYACNRMDIPTAAAVLERGDADFVGMCRGFVADPALVNKLASGRPDLVRPCVGCNQGCMDNIFKGRALGCLSNADAGFEEEKAEDIKLDEKILVIGAGVSGLEYALRAAKAGAKLSVWEEKNVYGGQSDLMSAPPTRKSFAELPLYQYNACLDNGVKFEFGKSAKAGEIANAVQSGEYDKVVVSTGALPILPDFETEDGANIVSAWDVLRGKAKTGKNVVVVGGGAAGVETALSLAAIGTIDAETLKFLFINKAESPERLYELLTCGSKKVTIVEMKPKIGSDIGASTKWIMMGDLRRYHVGMLADSKVTAIRKDAVVTEKSDGTVNEIKADTVVLAIGSKANDSLAKELEALIPGKVQTIGDAVKARKAYDAIKDARKALINHG